MGLLVAAGSLVLAAPAFAGVPSTLRLNGGFSFEEEGTTDVNTACVVADFVNFQVFGNVSGSSEGCAVNIEYVAVVPNKASASVLKDDNSGTAKVSQQVETTVFASIVAGEGCPVAGFSGEATPEKCKTSGSVKATEGGVNPDSVDSGKISVSCDVGEAASGLTPSPTVEQLDVIAAAFADRKDVKIDSKGKLTIKTKGVADDGDGCD
jgi:hypothetical protein